MPTERVFVVERARHFAGAWPQGFLRLDRHQGHALLQRWTADGFFVPRNDAERQPAWKQLIPYCLILRGAGEIFVVQRSSAQGESRLHGRSSIGLGGHLGPEDAGDARLIRRGLWRELHEELELPEPLPEPRFLGLLNDEASDVGRVHVGLVFRLDLAAQAAVRVRENHKMSGTFAPVPTSEPRSVDASGRCPDPALARVVETAKVWQNLDRFESWSRILLQARTWRDQDGSSSDDPAANRSQERIYDGGSENPQTE